jgi:hypothetical protein
VQPGGGRRVPLDAREQRRDVVRRRRGAQPQPHAPPQQPPDGRPAAEGDRTGSAEKPALPAPPTATATADQIRATSSCPSGQRTPFASAVTDRRTSKTDSQVRQR